MNTYLINEKYERITDNKSLHDALEESKNIDCLSAIKIIKNDGSSFYFGKNGMLEPTWI